MEAIDKACDYVLSGLGTKKNAVLMDGLFGKAAPLVGLSLIGAIATATGAMTGGRKPGSPVASAGEIAKSLKPKDEVHLEFTLRDARGGSAPLSASFPRRRARVVRMSLHH